MEAEKGNNQKNKEEFEAMKKKMKKMVIGCVITLAVAIAGAVIYKNTR